MTTTLRPAGPETRGADGERFRPYTVCVNSRPVGGVELRAGGRLGEGVGQIDALFVDEPDRRRGRGAVAALAGEEVLRSWGCTAALVAVPPDAEYALRLAHSLGYADRSRHMAKDVTGPAAALPPGSTARTLTGAQARPWLERGHRTYVAAVVAGGMPPEEAERRGRAGVAPLLRDGEPAPGTAMLGIDHDGERVGFVWLRTDAPPWVFNVEVDPGRRGRGHGRTAMLAAENHCREVGCAVLGLNVFSANTPALRLYESLGYRTTARHFVKRLV